MENLMTAFDVAEKHLDIPKMLDPEGDYPVSFLLALVTLWAVALGSRHRVLLSGELDCWLRVSFHPPVPHSPGAQ